MVRSLFMSLAAAALTVSVTAAQDGAVEVELNPHGPMDKSIKGGVAVVRQTEAEQWSVVVTWPETVELPEPHAVQDGAASYVVWAIDRLAEPHRVGEVRTGRAEGTVDAQPDEIIVSAESGRRPAKPGDVIVFRGDVRAGRPAAAGEAATATRPASQPTAAATRQVARVATATVVAVSQLPNTGFGTVDTGGFLAVLLIPALVVSAFAWWAWRGR
jgi:hypothetical protein